MATQEHRVCPYCGASYVVKAPKQIICGSPDCRNRSIVDRRRRHREAALAKVQPKPCRVCGKPVPRGIHGVRVTCGDPQCAEKWAAQRRQEYMLKYIQDGPVRKRGVVRQCLKCDKRFRSYDGSRTCSLCRAENAEIYMY